MRSKQVCARERECVWERERMRECMYVRERLRDLTVLHTHLHTR